MLYFTLATRLQALRVKHTDDLVYIDLRTRSSLLLALPLFT